MTVLERASSSVSPYVFLGRHLSSLYIGCQFDASHFQLGSANLGRKVIVAQRPVGKWVELTLNLKKTSAKLRAILQIFVGTLIGRERWKKEENACNLHIVRTVLEFFNHSSLFIDIVRLNCLISSFYQERASIKFYQTQPFNLSLWIQDIWLQGATSTALESFFSSSWREESHWTSHVLLESRRWPIGPSLVSLRRRNFWAS